mmetsp:Transcript_72122/g.127487  ORF Transcript_72122/g.127487 Transcript_72122/m.127487 type:complete len:84 (-) Transcript_72122:72-323(-)
MLLAVYIFREAVKRQSKLDCHHEDSVASGGNLGSTSDILWINLPPPVNVPCDSSSELAWDASQTIVTLQEANSRTLSDTTECT